jgi:hypothetical protein
MIENKFVTGIGTWRSAAYGLASWRSHGKSSRCFAALYLIFNMLNFFSINPKNDCYQQRRNKDDNNQEPIFFLHGIYRRRHFSKCENTCIPADDPNSEADKSLTPTGQKMEIYRKHL